MSNEHPLWRLIDRYAAAWTAAEIACSQDAHPGTLRRRNDSLDAARVALNEALSKLTEAKP